MSEPECTSRDIYIHAACEILPNNVPSLYEASDQFAGGCLFPAEFSNGEWASLPRFSIQRCTFLSFW